MFCTLVFRWFSSQLDCSDGSGSTLKILSERKKVVNDKDKVKQRLDEIRGSTQVLASRKYRLKDVSLLGG